MSNEKIQECLKQVSEALQKAQQIADETGEGFYFGGPGYGMGGHYTPKRKTYQFSKEELDVIKFAEQNCSLDMVENLKKHFTFDAGYDWESFDDDNHGWNSSSNDC